MTPRVYLNLSSTARHNEHQIFNHGDDHHGERSFYSPNSKGSVSSNSLTCHLFFNPITTHDQDEIFDGDQAHPSQNEDDENFGSQASDDDHMNKLENDQVKWMSSKMRVMLKMKKEENTSLSTIRHDLKLEDHHDKKEKASSSMEETANSINANDSSRNTLIRVCSNCNTTNTPLWRSGPQGPKSLCNACGIRQRKARKAMEAARAEEEETGKRVFHERPKSLKPTKNQHKDFKKPNKGHVMKFKNRENSSRFSSSSSRKNCVEEFLVSLKKSLEFHCVISQEEMEAAILLMSLSCGYVYQ